MNIPFFKLFDPHYELHAGLAVEADTYHYILLARSAKAAPSIISLRKGALASLKRPFSCPLHANLGAAQALLVTETIHGQNPEEWIDAHESRIIPLGTASHEIMNEWRIDAETIYSCTITKKAYEKVLSDAHFDSMILASLGMPLWNLARLYSRKISGPYFLWKLSNKHSLLGFVDRGNLRGLCNFWAGADDVATDTKVINQLLRLAQSLAKGAPCDTIVVYHEDEKKINIEKLLISGLKVKAPPVLDNVPLEYHEAYGLALQDDRGIDFGETVRALEARDWAASRGRALRIIRGAVAIAAIVAAGLIILKGGAFIGAQYVNGKMAAITGHLERYKKENVRLESLTAQIKDKAWFMGRKSMLTYPVSEMQTAFPEGVWAEEIVFSEAGQETWNLSIIAFSGSSALIPELLKGLSSIKGMDKVRMAYSEQTTVRSKTGERAIKFRLEGIYKKEPF